MTRDVKRCLGAIESSGSINPKTYRCQREAGHDGQCLYWRRDGRGVALYNWWGANPPPVDWLGDFDALDDPTEP